MEETGWLIESEKDGAPVWWNPVCWSTDSLRATRFARKEDAQSLIDDFEIDKAKATEHKWVDDTPPGICALCGKPMPKGEEMFKYHGYSGPCPKD